MALKNKVMTLNEVIALEEVHRQAWKSLMGSVSGVSAIKGVLIEAGMTVARFAKFLGPIGTIDAIAELIWGFNDASNKDKTMKDLIGAEETFKAVRLRLSGSYRAAEVQQVWIKYPSVSTTAEFVQGNFSTPEKAYKILRLQKSDGTWITPIS